MDSVTDPYLFGMGVSPFGHPRVIAYFQLTGAYRRLSRPSSALGAKAFTLCSFSLEQPHLLNSLEFQVRFLLLELIANNCFGLQIWKDFQIHTVFPPTYFHMSTAKSVVYPCFTEKPILFFSLQLSVLFAIRFSMNNPNLTRRPPTKLLRREV